MMWLRVEEGLETRWVIEKAKGVVSI